MSEPYPFEKTFGHGLVLGKFYPLHAGHQPLIRAALRRCDRVTVELLGSQRRDHPARGARGVAARGAPDGAHVVAAIDDTRVDFDDPAAWDAHMVVISELLPAPGRRGLHLRRLRRGARPAAGRDLGPGRSRAGAQPGLRHRRPRRPDRALGRAAGSGPRLARPSGSWCSARSRPAPRRWPRRSPPAWAPTGSRSTAGSGRDPPRRPVRRPVAQRRVRPDRRPADRLGGRRAAAGLPKPVLVCDTDVLATTLWHERYVGPTPDHLVERAAAHRPVAYVLTGDEIPFVQDGMRDGEHLRHGMQERFREVLAAQPVPWIEVRGSVQERLAATQEFLEPPARARQPDRPVIRRGTGLAMRWRPLAEDFGVADRAARPARRAARRADRRGPLQVPGRDRRAGREAAACVLLAGQQGGDLPVLRRRVRRREAPIRFPLGDAGAEITLPTQPAYSSNVLLPLLTFAVGGQVPADRRAGPRQDDARGADGGAVRGRPRRTYAATSSRGSRS